MKGEVAQSRGLTMKTVELNRPSFWQLVFAQSKVNGGGYFGEELPVTKWNWPKDTYLQQRVRGRKCYEATQAPHKSEARCRYQKTDPNYVL
jgi:hypothetical protein